MKFASSGDSILPLLKSPKEILKRDTLYWHLPHSIYSPNAPSSGAIRKGDWKLIEFFDTGKLELYNLNDDIGEKNDLSKKYPKKVSELHNLLANWRKDVGCKVPERQKSG